MTTSEHALKGEIARHHLRHWQIGIGGAMPTSQRLRKLDPTHPIGPAEFERRPNVRRVGAPTIFFAEDADPTLPAMGLTVLKTPAMFPTARALCERLVALSGASVRTSRCC